MKKILFFLDLMPYFKGKSKSLWLFSLLLFFIGNNAMGQTLFMTKETKDIVSDIANNYEWKTVSLIVNHDLGEFIWYMEQSNGSEKITLINCQPQDRNLDQYWVAEKDSLDVIYGDRISKLNKVQRTLLFEKLNSEWKDFVKDYRYNCALYNAHINCNRYIGLLEEQKEDSISKRNEFNQTLETLGHLEVENKSKTVTLSNLKKELDELYVKENRLYSENRQLQYDLEDKRFVKSHSFTGISGNKTQRDIKRSFSNDASVWAYMQQITWKNIEGYKIHLTSGGLTINGVDAMCYTPVITNMSSDYAVIKVELINPRGTLVFRVYPQRNLMIDKDGNRFMGSK